MKDKQKNKNIFFLKPINTKFSQDWINENFDLALRKYILFSWKLQQQGSGEQTA